MDAFKELEKLLIENQEILIRMKNEWDEEEREENKND